MESAAGRFGMIFVMHLDTDPVNRGRFGAKSECAVGSGRVERCLTERSRGVSAGGQCRARMSSRAWSTERGICDLRGDSMGGEARSR